MMKISLVTQEVAGIRITNCFWRLKIIFVYLKKLSCFHDIGFFIDY